MCVCVKDKVLTNLNVFQYLRGGHYFIMNLKEKDTILFLDSNCNSVPKLIQIALVIIGFESPEE